MSQVAGTASGQPEAPMLSSSYSLVLAKKVMGPPSRTCQWACVLSAGRNADSTGAIAECQKGQRT